MMANRHSQIKRESNTLALMIKTYCHDWHGNKDICSDCLKLLDYAQERLERCQFQEGKTTCTKCPVHCYKPEMRTKIKTVMRYSGPRMIYHHPFLTISHLLDGLRKKPVINNSRTKPFV